MVAPEKRKDGMPKKHDSKKKWEKEVAMSEKNIICQGMIKERGNQHFKE